MNELLQKILKDYVVKNNQINLNSSAARENLTSFIIEKLKENDYIIVERYGDVLD